MGSDKHVPDQQEHRAALLMCDSRRRSALALGVLRAAAAVCVAVACSPAPATFSASAANAGIDSLNARLSQAYRDRDPLAYGALYTDSAVFEWPAFTTVRGRARMEAMARGNWASLRDMDLKLIVSSRRVQPNQATEFGAFEQSYSDSSGARMTEFGRYVVSLARDSTAEWKIDRFFGFADSSRAAPKRLLTR
jgi:ketosteroid isomerase-like protein